ncbi:MAG: hypothetical protein EOP85_15150 [Verrucomicrobiaceae bacterium]|nr:MAG: hypothetical protein EOP85_15150 [Verrucomicrobiaceae bacterium]
MRHLLTWLMVFCVVAGLNARALGAESLHVGTCSHVEETCVDHSHDCDSHDHGHDHDNEDGKCPPDHHHHHHGCCPAGQPLTVENDHFRQPVFFGSLLLGVRHDGELAPEEPFLGSEKPPLI